VTGRGRDGEARYLCGFREVADPTDQAVESMLSGAADLIADARSRHEQHISMFALDDHGASRAALTLGPSRRLTNGWVVTGATLPGDR